MHESGVSEGVLLTPQSKSHPCRTRLISNSCRCYKTIGKTVFYLTEAYTDFIPTLHYAKLYHNSTWIITCECGFGEQIMIIINIFDKGHFLSKIIESHS